MTVTRTIASALAAAALAVTVAACGGSEAADKPASSAAQVRDQDYMAELGADVSSSFVVDDPAPIIKLGKLVCTTHAEGYSATALRDELETSMTKLDRAELTKFIDVSARTYCPDQRTAMLDELGV